MSDTGHQLTDKKLAKLESRISDVFDAAAKELQGTIDAYFEAFAKRDEEMKKLIGTEQHGKVWSETDYKKWRLNQIARGERFEALRDKLAQRVTDAHALAVDYCNDVIPSVYSLNRNYAAYTIEQVTDKADFTLWDENTVKRLITQQPDLMPNYPASRALKRGIDLEYGRKQITASVTSSILQGKSIKHMADDLQSRIGDMSRTSAIRTARTAVTEAQNAGRMDSYRAAQDMGISLKREWVAALDNRTRHAHAMLDGQKADIDKPFKVDGYEIMYPGDRSAPGYLVYNCRCTLVADVDGVDTSNAQRRARNPETGQNELVQNQTFSEWENQKKVSGEIEKLRNDGIIEEKNLFDKDSYKSVPAQEAKLFARESGSCSASDYRQINSHAKQDGSKGGYVRSHQAWEFNRTLRTVGEDALDYDDKKTLATIRNVCKNNTAKRNVILDRYVNSDYLNEYNGVFNRYREDLVKDAVSFAKEHLLGREKTELSIVSASYGNNVLTDRDIHVRLFCDEGTHLFVTKNSRESEVLFHDGLTYEFFGADIEEFESGLFKSKRWRLVLNAFVKYGGLPK